MASSGLHPSAEEIEDEIIFQQTLLESLGDVPSDDETKLAVLKTIEELEKRLSDHAAGSDLDIAGSDTEAPTESDGSMPSSTGKRPATDVPNDRQQKRHRQGKPQLSAAKMAAQRALQRAREAEARAIARRETEAADAAYAQQLYAQAGESSTSASSSSPYTHVPAFPQHRALPSHSQSQRNTYQSSILQPPPHRVKAESGRASKVSGQDNRRSDVVDLTGDEPTASTSSSSQQLATSADPNFGPYARDVGYGHDTSWHRTPQTSMDRLREADRNGSLNAQQKAALDYVQRTRGQGVERYNQEQRNILDAERRAAQQQVQHVPGAYVYGTHAITAPGPFYPQQHAPSIYQSQVTPPSVYGTFQSVARSIAEATDLMFGSSSKPKPFDDDWANDTVHDPVELTEDLKNLMDNIRPDEELPVEEQDVEIEAMTVKLKPYQGAGLTWLQNQEEGTNKGGILADDMGLGKTVQAIALMSTRRSPALSNKTTLILCPVALLRQWQEEIATKLKRGNHRMSVFIHHQAHKKKTHEELRGFDVVLTTFGTVASEMKKRDKFLARKEIDREAVERSDEKCIFIGPENKWYRVIVDEAQNIKNRSTLSSRGACHLDAQFRLCMTGTPMMNSVDELYSLIKFLRIRPYNDWTKFNYEFSRPIKSNNDDFRDAAMKRLQALLKAILLRRHKKSTINGKPILILPERTVEQTITDFTPEERDFYAALETQQRIQFNKYVKAGTVGRSYAHILVMLLRLRQACCHPHLVKDFGVQMAADITPEKMAEIAESLDAAVIERIKASKGEFECPVCYDAVDNPAIFVPCGHDTCADCYVRIKESARDGEHTAEVGQNKAKCPNCRGAIDPKQVIDYETFKKVQLPQPLEEDDFPVVGPSGRTGSETESDPEATDSEDESGDSDDDEDEMDGFVVGDDVVDDEGYRGPRKPKKPTKLIRKGNQRASPDSSGTESEDEGLNSGNTPKAKRMAPIFGSKRPGAIPFDSDDEDAGSATHAESDDVPKQDRCRSKGKKKELSDPLADAVDSEAQVPGGSEKKRRERRKAKKPKGKGKGKAPAPPLKKRAHQKTIAELKKLATRSRAAKREYLERIRKDFIDSAKVSKAIELLRHIIDTSDEKIIVFSQWTSLLDLLEVPIDEAGWSYTRYDGSMPAKSRADAVDEFKDATRRPQMRLMLVSLKAGNAGLNLNCASQVIILDPFWNPYIEEQAIDRAHRLGQEREVKVHRLLVQDTVEDRILKLQEDKRSMINEALDEGAAQRLSRLSQQELGYLFGVRARPH
ncbi:hypothetical protein CAC42_7038 [Sphaceloma murrayae]|uniref:Uncharacterized protein n=1 Tax=Sphaceloma murrayae TaxID=2082308 RepID=A0A2K1QQN2_9PEZI|nr:hypothetical protein CAC42_7038 [Sphaceloma murrayae]